MTSTRQSQEHTMNNLNVGDIVTYLGRAYSVANVTKTGVVLSYTFGAKTGYMTVPASMVKISA